MKMRCSQLGLATLGIALSCAVASPSPADKVKKYARVVPVGTAIFRLENSCIDMFAQMSSGGFFEGLQKRENQGVVSFQKNLRPVESYPEYVRLRVFALSGNCSSSRPSMPTDDAAQLMRTARFHALCGTASSERTVEVSSRGVQVPAVNSMAWTYYLNIHSDRCSISAPLTVNMVGPTGLPLAQFQAQL